MMIRRGMALVLAGLLAACGGGGDSPEAKVDPANEADGLGSAGHPASTAELGNAALSGAEHSGTPQVAIALSDQGRALAVWQVMAPQAGDKTAAWAQTSTTGTWGPATPLPQAHNSSGFFNLTLRMNQHGNAALGWVNQALVAPSTEEADYRVARFIQSAGWDTPTYDASGGTSASTYGSSNAWDLAMLDDDSFTASVRMPGTSGYTSAILRNDQLGQQTINQQGSNQTSLIYYPYAAFTPKSNGYGLLYRLSDSISSPGQVDIKAQLSSIYSGALGAFPIATYRGVCYNEAYDSPLVAAITPQAEGVLAVLAADVIGSTATCQSHNLQLHRVYTASSIMVTSTRLNSLGTSLPVSPAVAVDQSGNALVVWKESTGSSFGSTPGSTVRLMWSKSSYGGTWSTPAPLVTNLSALGTVPSWGHVSLAMNASGQAVVSVKLDGLVNSSINQSILIGRFTFADGWTGWRVVANKQNLSEPQVAINASGQAVIAYTALSAPRVNGRAPTSFSSTSTPVKAFAYSF